MCIHASSFEYFAPFLVASSSREHNIDQQRPGDLATGPQCGGCWGRAVWLQASGADGRHSVSPRARWHHMTACSYQQGDIDTINNNYDFLLQFLNHCVKFLLRCLSHTNFRVFSHKTGKLPKPPFFFCPFKPEKLCTNVTCCC